MIPLNVMNLVNTGLNAADQQGGSIPGAPENPRANASTVQDTIKVLQGIYGTGNVTNRPDVIMPKPMAPQQQTPMPLRDSDSKKASVHNFFANVGNMLQKVNQHEQEKTARDVEYDLSRIQTALSNPTPENKQLVDEILSDSKRRKRLEKALNINFFGEDKNSNTPERAGLKNYADKLLKSMPKTPQLDPQAQMTMQLIQAGMVPKADALVQLQGTLQAQQARLEGELMRAQSAEERNRTLMNIANLRRLQEDVKLRAQMAIQKQRGIDARDVANIRGKYQVEAAKARGPIGGKTVLDRITDNMEKEYKVNADTIAKEQKEISTIQDNLRKAKGEGGGASGDRMHQLQKHINDLKQRQDMLTNKLSDVYKLNESVGGGEDNGGQDNSDDGTGDNTDDQFLNDLENVLKDNNF